VTVSRGRSGGDRGSITLELAILAPAVLVLLGLVVVAGRIEIAGGAVEQASAAAAREASLARSPEAARQAATRAAMDDLNGQDLHCTDLTVIVDTAGFNVPVGSPAQVSARVSCTVGLSDISVPGMPGARTLMAETQSSLDRYRSR
jgi:Flp pilus assembly protein TadG